MSLMWLALCEAMTGQGEAARAHARCRCGSTRAISGSESPHLALAMVSFAARDYAEAARWAELAIQSEPAVPFRRAIMIACCARTGDLERAARERAVLDGFAPELLASLFRGDI